jgi:pimeloyl-ACP methyl ester carboxylesterase
MNTPANHTARASQPGSVPSVRETSYLGGPEGRIGYDVAGDGALVVLVPGMGDLRAGCRFLAPGLRAAGYRVACTDLRGHGDSDATFTSCGDEETAGDVIALIEVLGGPAVVVGNPMGAGATVLAVAQRPELVSGLVLVGPFVRNGKISTVRRLLLRAAMAPPWAASSWKSYLPKLYAGRRPADFGDYRDQVITSMRRPGYAKAFSRTTRTTHDPAQARLADVTAPALVVMGEQDPDFPDPRAEADWVARALRARVVMVPGAGHYPSRSGPTSPPARCCASWNRSRGVPSARLIQASSAVILRVAAGKARSLAGGRVRGHGPGRRWFAGGMCACPGWLIGMTATTWGYRP